MQPRPARSVPGTAPRAGARPLRRASGSPLPVRHPAPSRPGPCHVSLCSPLFPPLARAHARSQPARPPLRLISLAPVPCPPPNPSFRLTQLLPGPTSSASPHPFPLSLGLSAALLEPAPSSRPQTGGIPSHTSNATPLTP